MELNKIIEQSRKIVKYRVENQVENKHYPIEYPIILKDFAKNIASIVMEKMPNHISYINDKKYVSYKIRENIQVRCNLCNNMLAVDEATVTIKLGVFPKDEQDDSVFIAIDTMSEYLPTTICDMDLKKLIIG